MINNHKKARFPHLLTTFTYLSQQQRVGACTISMNWVWNVWGGDGGKRNEILVNRFCFSFDLGQVQDHTRLLCVEFVSFSGGQREMWPRSVADYTQARYSLSRWHFLSIISRVCEHDEVQLTCESRVDLTPNLSLMCARRVISEKNSRETSMIYDH